MTATTGTASPAEDVVPSDLGEGTGGTTLTAQEIDLRLAVLAVLAAQLKAEDARLRAQRRTTLRPGERFAVVLPGDQTEIAWVSVTRPSGGGRLTADVTDLAQLVAWCREHRPWALTETVRTSDQQVLCEQVRSTGEVIPGITLSQTSPSAPALRVNVEDGALGRLVAAVRSRQVELPHALGLPGGDV